MRIRLVASRLLIRRPVIGRGAYNGKSGREIHPILERQRLEWSQSLVMIHGECRIEQAVIAEPEETVRRIRTECHDTFFVGLFNRRKDDFLLFVTEQSAVPAMRIQPQDCDFRMVDAEIPLQGMLQQPEFGQDLFLRDA